MKRHALLVAIFSVGVVALVAFAALSQEGGKPDLSTLLLSQDVFRQVFADDSWVLAAANALPNPPEGAQSASAFYENPSQKVTLILFDFSDPNLAGKFLKQVLDPNGPGLRDKPVDILDLINVETQTNVATTASFVPFKNGQNRLVYTRDNLVVFLQGELPQETLIQLAQLHLDQLADLGR